MSKGLWKASANGITDLITWTSGRLRDGASDLEGRIWTRLFVDGAAVSSTNPLPVTGGTSGAFEVQGLLAHDAIDDANGGAGVGEFPVFIGGRARTATPAAVADGDVVRSYWDANGRLVVKDEAVHPGEDDTNNVLGVTTKPLAVSTYAPPLAAANLGAATDINIKAAPGCLMALSGENRNAAVRYMQIHNLAAAIGAAAVPLMSFPVPGGGGFNLIGTDFWTIPGLWLSTGIRIGWSTTMGTYTAATASEHTTNWQAV